MMPTPKFCFQSGELAISTPTRLYRIRGWPEPRAFEKVRDGDWKKCQPEFRLVKPHTGVNFTASGASSPCEDSCGPDLAQTVDAPDQKRKAFEAFRSQLPQRVAQVIEHFQSHQWNLLELLSKENAAHDLAESNAVLFWCLANNDQFRRPCGLASPAEYARPYVARRQREILGWLGFPESEASVKVMRKIIPEAITALYARMLRRAVADPLAAHFLSHVRPINSGVLGLACNRELLPFTTARLLAEVARSDEEIIRQPTADLLLDAIYLAVMSRLRLPVPLFVSVASVQEYHDRVIG